MLTDKRELVVAGLGVVLVTTTVVVWSWWAGVVLLCPLLVVGGLYLKRRLENNRLDRTAPQPVYQPPQPVPPASTAVRGLVLPSAQRDYRFLLSATVLWRHLGTQVMPHLRPDQLAIDAVRDRATMVTERESAADTDLLAPRLAAELSIQRPDRTGHLEVWALDTTLTIPDDDRQRLDKLAKVRKDEEVWDHERAHERNKRAYLREDVLSSTGSAVVWWLSRDTARVQETVDLIGTLSKLVAAANDREVEPVFRTFVNNLTDPSLRPPHQDDFVDRLMTEILPHGSEPERADIADRLAILATDAGATDLAHTLRTRYNAPDFAVTPDPGLFDRTETNPIPAPPSAVHPNGQAESGTPGPAGS